MSKLGQKLNRPPEEVKINAVKWLLGYGKENLAKRTSEQLLAELIEVYKFPFPKSTFRRLVSQLELELKPSRTRKGITRVTKTGTEVNSFGNARRIMFLARIVKSFMKECGSPIPEMLEILVKGVSIPENIADTEVTQ